MWVRGKVRLGGEGGSRLIQGGGARDEGPAQGEEGRRAGNQLRQFLVPIDEA